MKTKIKSGKKIKVIVLLIIFVAIPALLYVGMFVPFYKDIPDNYKSSFHSYDEALAYARTIDPDAEVEKEYEDITVYLFAVHSTGLSREEAEIIKLQNPQALLVSNG